MHSFISELRRRNVLRVAAFYAAAGWLLVQVATQVFPFFDIPNGVVRIVVIACALGFAPALLFAWFYELTPQGLKLESEIAADASITRQTGRKLDRWIIAILTLAVLLLLADRLVLRRSSSSPVLAATSASIDKSIAVLPFENLSDDKSNAYFASGIQDEILTRLAKIGALKVISRTSTQHYASSPDNLPEIAKQLGVANILEGSVQKAGNVVHVNVQLIRAASDDHLWAESYDRKLDNLFGVEGEVAGAIAEQLNARLSGAEQQAVSARPTDSLAAYDAFLRGRALNDGGFDYGVQRKVAAAFAEAVRLDPRFALAWAHLAMVQAFLYFNNVDPAAYTAASIKQAADTALQLQPGLGEAQLALGYYRYRVLRDFAGAHAAFEAALRQLPNDPLAWQALGLVERREGQWDQALAHMQHAAELDPRNVGTLVSIGGETLSNLRRFDEAHAWLDRALSLAPADAFALSYKVYADQAEGRLEQAAHLLDTIPQAGEDPQLTVARSYQRLLERRYDAVIAEVQPLLSQPEASLNGVGPQLAIYLGAAQGAAGQTQQAHATFERLIARIKPLAAGRVDDTLMAVTLALAYAGAGDNKAALDQAHHAVALYRNDGIQRPFAELVLAQVQAMGGDHDAAIAGLEQSLKVPAGTTPALLRLDPAWDPLRGDPRFQKLIADNDAPVAKP